jgi:hypothetical protein
MTYKSNLTVSVSPGQIYICTQYGGIQIPMADVRPLRDHLNHIIQRIDDEAAGEPLPRFGLAPEPDVGDMKL